MVFSDRTEAGRQLAAELRYYTDRADVIVLGLPRGGVPVAFEIAGALDAPLDVLVLRKLGVPGQEELAFGAIANGGVRVLNEEIVEAVGISDREIQLVATREKKELERREKAYRGGRPALKVEGRTVILVDDGIATGSSMLAAVNALRRLKPARLVVAAPVAGVSACNRLLTKVDELVCLFRPEFFNAVGEFYRDFSQVADEEVTELLHRAERPTMQQAM